ncbi:MAG TPA: hypothetical protein VNB91_16880 [Jatrophihabitantaceae bacterium]|nr:hypothetical protein [Jatrophihabitantaceae bacterium]
MRRSAAAVALLLALPLVVAASDPRGDVVPCGSASVDASAPDLVAIEATAQELETAAVWRLTFARPLVVPDPGAPPARIDILVRDPKIPGMSVDGQPGVNRVVRWDATSVEQPIVVKWIPEHSQVSFNPPVIEGNRVELRVPGRILLGESPDGTESVTRLRWSARVSDGPGCDVVGGRPALRLQTAGTSSPPVAPAPATSSEDAGATSSALRILIVGGSIVLGLLAFWGLRRFGPR